jgi:hypothetical protein
MNETKMYSAAQIRNMMLSQRFADWYETKFDDYVCNGDEPDSSEIEADIENMLK